MSTPIDLLSDLIAHARAAGADAADAVLIAGTSLSVQRRVGETEHVERSEGRDLGLRVFLGKRAAVLLPKVRDWMSANSWIVSELVIALFVGIEINSLVKS